MNKQLNTLEEALLEAIIEENSIDYPFLKDHYQLLSVSSRKNTGVGIYTNFEYSKELKEEGVNVIISSNKTLTFEGLENELTYVLDISNGKITFMEIVTNGNDILPENKYDYNFRFF